VTIYATWCKGWRICVEFCLQNLAMDPGEIIHALVLPDKMYRLPFFVTRIALTWRFVVRKWK